MAEYIKQEEAIADNSKIKHIGNDLRVKAVQRTVSTIVDYKKNDKELDIVLKKGVKFHDGSELTADDVIFSIERMKKQPGSEVMVKEIDKVEKVNDYEIKILLSDLSRNIENDSLINMLYGDLYVKEKFYIKASLYYKKNSELNFNFKSKEANITFESKLN
mgnify:CR=1 FL=1